MPSTNRLDVALALPLRNPAELAALLQDLYDPASPRYHQFLSANEFADRFGPDARDYHRLIAFMESHGLRVVERHANRALLHVSGTADDVERTFHVALQVYRHPTESRNFHAPDRAPSLDLDLPILDVRGLEDYHRPEPALQIRALGAPGTPSLATGSGPSGAFMGLDFRKVYAPGVTLTGAGQTVALFEMAGYDTNDIIAYETQAGLPSVTLSNVLLGGVDGTPQYPYASIEPALDIELAIAMAPGLSRVIVYQAPLSSVGAYDILNRMATDNAARQISSSWVIDQIVTNPVPNQIYQQFAAQGQSFFQASGDQGAFFPSVFQYADNPYLTIVGGTSLTTTGPAGAWAAETTWSWSGGGISTTFPIPSYQQGISMWRNLGSTTMRNVPDVAMVADNVFAVANSNNLAVSGTSCSAPLWAGFAALLNQQAARNGQPPLGFLNPALYALGQQASYSLALHDITTGGTQSLYGYYRYYAAQGYDLCTGWGTPNGSNLVQALVPAADPLQISPGVGFAASGPAGGWFWPETQSYSVKNTGLAPISWTLMNTSAWLSVSATSGQALPGGLPSIVNVTINGAANNLVDGIYSSVIWFTNLNDGVAQSREFILQIAAAPAVIYSQPVNQTVLVGQTASFQVGVSGTGLHYSWQKNGVPLADGGRISGCGTSLLTINGATLADVGTYSVVVGNSSGSVTSAGAALVLYQPGSNILVNGGFETGDFSGWALAGNTNLAAVTGNGFAVRSGAYGAQFGSAGSLAFLTQIVPTIPGATYALSAWLDSPSGLVPSEFLVQWDGTNVFDAGNLPALGWTNLQFIVTASGTNTTLVFGFRDDPSYLALDDVSVTLITNVLSPPIITRQPRGQEVTAGGVASFSVTANGTAPLSYRWQSHGTNLVDGGNVRGATSSQLTITNVNPANAGFYSVLVSNAYGAALSRAAALVVLPPGAVTLNFDDLSPGGSVPLGYGGIAWSGLIVADDVNLFPYIPANSGYTAGMVSSNNVAADLDGLTAALSSTTSPFNLYSAYLTAAWNDGLQVVALGYIGSNTLAYSNCYTLSATEPTLIGFNFSNVTTVTFTPSGGTQHPGYAGYGTQFVIDNLALSLAGPVVITGQPANQSVAVGGPANFTVNAVGSLPLTFQWLRNGVPLDDTATRSGTHSNSLTLPNIASGDAGFYSVIVSNSFGPVTSSPALLLVATLQPTNLVVNGGFETGDFNGWSRGSDTNPSSVTTNSLAVHSGNFGANLFSVSTGYLWQQLATTPDTNYLLSFWLNSPSPADFNDLRVQWNGSSVFDHTLLSTTGWTNIQIMVQATGTNTLLQFSFYNDASAFGVDDISVSPISLLATPPSLQRQPLDQETPLGGTATFTVGASGTAPLQYQWQCNGTNLADGENISGVTTATLTISNVSPANLGLYSVVVTNAFGKIVSANARLTLLPAGAVVITFDDLPETITGLAISNGYAGLSWNNFYEVDGLNSADYHPAASAVVASVRNVAYTGSYPSSGFSSAGPFNLYSAYMTASGNSDLTILGYSGGSLRYSNSYSLSASAPTLIHFNYTNVTEVDFLSGYYYGPIFYLDNVALSFNGAPWIAAQPANQSAFAGAAVQLAVAAFGSAPITYQWRKNGVDVTDGFNVAGARTSSLVLSNVSLADAGVYTVVVSNQYGGLLSDAAALTVHTLGTANLVQNGGFETGDFTAWVQYANMKSSYITRDPGYVHSDLYGAQLGPDGWNGEIYQALSGTTPGGLYLLSFWLASLPPASGYADFAVSWNSFSVLNQYNIGVFGWTNLQFLVTADSPNSYLQFSFQNDQGYFALDDISVRPILATAAPPAIGGQPSSAELPSGATATFSVGATGAAPLSYQWWHNGTNLADDGRISGAASSQLLIMNVGSGDVGKYSVVVTNPYGVTTSASAALSVVQVPPGEELITFDDLPPALSGQLIANGYAGLNWSNFSVFDAIDTAYYQPAMRVGMLSPTNVATVGYWNTATISSTNNLFDLISGYLTTYAATPVRVLGYAGSTLLYSNVYMPTSVTPTLVSFNYSNVSLVSFSIDWSYNALVLDNLLVSTNNSSAPIIASQPNNTIAPLGGAASFNVAAVGSQPLAYQWLLNGRVLADDSNYSGCTTAQLIVSHAAAAQAGSYSALVTNLYGTAFSTVAVLSVYTFGTNNLLRNGDFETGDFYGWQTSGDPKNVYVSTNAGYAHTGRFGAQLGPVSNFQLVQSVPTTPGALYQISLWLNWDGQGSCWIYWSGNYLFGTYSGLSGIGWTNLQFVVPVYDSSSTLEVDVRDGPGYLGLDDLSVIAATFVTAPTPVEILPPQYSNGAVSFSFATIPGQSYTIQQATDLATSNWVTFTSFTATSSVYSCSIPIAASQPRIFFRVRQP